MSRHNRRFSRPEKPTRPAQIDPSQLYSVREVCAALCIGRTTLYHLVKAGKIATVQLDDRPRFTGAEIQRVVNSAAQAA